MRARSAISALVLSLMLTGLAFAQNQFDNAKYLKSVPGKKKGEPVKGTLVFDNNNKVVTFQTKKGSEFSIPYASVQRMLYERTSRPRYAMGMLIAWPLLFTKSKGHYLTIHYADPQGANQFVIMHLHKSNFRDAVNTAEAAVGKKVERSEER